MWDRVAGVGKYKVSTRGQLSDLIFAHTVKHFDSRHPYYYSNLYVIWKCSIFTGSYYSDIVKYMYFIALEYIYM